MGHPPRIPVWLKPDQPVVYFLTFCVANRQKVLANDTTFAAFKAAVTRLTKWNVIAAILMPDPSRAESELAMATGQFRPAASVRRIGRGEMAIHP
jgi:hypothetical protein